MSKLTLSDIMMSGYKVFTGELDTKEKKVSELLERTHKKQAELIKLQDVNQESLRMVVKL